MWNTVFSDATGSNKTALSVEDRITVNIVDPSIKKENDRYYVKMPFKTRPQDFPNNRSVAGKRLRYLKNKLIHQTHLQEGYIKTVDGYIKDGYARKLTRRIRSLKKASLGCGISHTMPLQIQRSPKRCESSLIAA